MLFILVLSNIFITAMATTTSSPLIQFDKETLTKLRLSSTNLATAVSYIDYELLNEYQCAIECIKEQSICTGYTYNQANKICSLFDDASRTVDKDITKLVSCIC